MPPRLNYTDHCPESAAQRPPTDTQFPEPLWTTVKGMGDEARAEVFDQLRRVIAWEVKAQSGIQRAIEDMPPLIADTLMDHFDISLKSGADISEFDH